MTEKKSIIIGVISFMVGMILMFLLLFTLGTFYISTYSDVEDFGLISYDDLTEEETLEVVNNTCELFCSMLPLNLEITNYNWSLLTEKVFDLECYCINGFGSVVASQRMYIETGGV